MKVETTRFGVIDVDEETLLTFADGIPGFPGMHRMARLGSGQVPGQPDVGTEQQTMYWLQDVDDGELAFLCIVPWAVFPEYDVDLDVESLGITDERDVCVLAIVTVRRDGGAMLMSANLRAPIVVNVATRAGRQVILTTSRWPVVATFATSGVKEVV